MDGCHGRHDCPRWPGVAVLDKEYPDDTLAAGLANVCPMVSLLSCASFKTNLALAQEKQVRKISTAAWGF